MITLLDYSSRKLALGEDLYPEDRGKATIKRQKLSHTVLNFGKNIRCKLALLLCIYLQVTTAYICARKIISVVQKTHTVIKTAIMIKAIKITYNKNDDINDN